MLYSPLAEKALRFAAEKHAGQCRKGTTIPYLTHLAGVAIVLARAGFDNDEVLAAALLHDAIEDAGVTADEVTKDFTDRVAELVIAASEVKYDADGTKRDWKPRKTEHLVRIAAASVDARAIVLADKLHNLGTLLDDLARDADVWNRFNAGAPEQVWYYEAVLDAVGDAAQLERLCTEYRMLLNRLRSVATTA